MFGDSWYTIFFKNTQIGSQMASNPLNEEAMKWTSSPSTDWIILVQILTLNEVELRKTTILVKNRVFLALSEFWKRIVPEQSLVRLSCPIFSFGGIRLNYSLFRCGAPNHNWRYVFWDFNKFQLEVPNPFPTVWFLYKSRLRKSTLIRKYYSFE